ncbi:MAG TPA: efflux RND transporter permease subunit, partial [Pirellulales bacterium]|nr:efflux RND transporter permease subunit [Pirellulales bacterium]
MNRRTSFLAGAVLLLALSHVLAAETPQPKIEYLPFKLPEAHFQCELPKDWGVIRDKHEEERTHCFGVYTFGPKQDAPDSPTLSARYFAPDNTYFRGAEGYLRRQLEPGLIQLKDEKTSAPKQVLLDGRQAVTFTRDTFDFPMPETIDAKRFPLREEYFVLPYKQGFVVLIYKAPTVVFDRWRPALQHLLDTFRLLPEHVVVTLRAATPGWEAEKIETAVARPLETCLSGLEGLAEMRSASYRGECTIWLKLKHNADMAVNLQEIQRRIAQAQDKLPSTVVCTLEPIAGDERQRALIAVCSADESRPRETVLTELETLTDRVVRDRLQVVPGVASVTVVGGGQRYEIVPLPERLAAQDIGVQELLDAVRKLGADETPIRSEIGIESSLEDVRRAIVAVRNGESITVGDLARVRLGRAHGTANRLWLTDDAGQVRSPAAVLLVVDTLTNADAGAVYRAVDA